MPNWNGKFHAVSKNISRHSHWQYGSGKHRSAKHKTFGFIVLSLLTNAVCRTKIRYLILGDSSQKIISRNLICNRILFIAVVADSRLPARMKFKKFKH